MDKPQVITWFKVYVVFMVILYLLLSGLGAFFMIAPDALTDSSGKSLQQAMNEEAEMFLIGLMYFVLGIVLAAAFAVGLFTPRRFWSWIYNLVLICLGMTSCCTWPATIPLLIYWVKAENREWYKYKP